MINRQRLLERFLKYISCSSESLNEKDFCILMENELTSLGLSISRDEIGHIIGSNGWNIHAELPGEGEPILLSCHLDTVTPGENIKPEIIDGVIWSDKTTILGADDKSGIAAVMEAVETVIEQNIPHRPVEIMFSLAEELGLLGAREADYSKIKSKNALVLDSSMNGCIINMAAAQAKLHFHITGKAAHAGVAPEKGIHALKAAAEAVSNIPCGYPDDISVMNVSNFISEGATNIVAADATFDMEIRSFSEETLKAHYEATLKSVKNACDKYGASFTHTYEKHSGLIHIPEDDPFLKSVMEAYEKMGKTPKLCRTYGGCDATWLTANNIKALNLGTGMQNAHAVDEHIKIEDLEFTAQFLEAVITK